MKFSTLIVASALCGPTLAAAAEAPSTGSTRFEAPVTLERSSLAARETARERKGWRKMRPVPALVVGTVAGFGVGFVGGLAHPLIGGALTPWATATGVHFFTDAGFGWEVLGAHVGWFGASPVGIPARVLLPNDGNGTSPLDVALSGAFAFTSAVGAVTAAAIDSKNKKKRRLEGARPPVQVSFAPTVSRAYTGAAFRLRW